MWKTIVTCALISSILLPGCVSIPKKTVRIEDRLWMEKDYDRRLDAWPVGYKIEKVLTRFGHSQVLISGENNSESILFLHAMGFNLTSWANNVTELSKNYRVIAIDLIGDQGRSIARRDYAENIQEYSFWLDDIVQHYGLKEINLVGNSMGGWIAHGYAIYYPDNMKNLILISPAAGIPQKTTWMSFILKMLTTSDEEKLKKICAPLLGPYNASKDWIDYMAKATRDSKCAKIGIPTEFSDETLAKTGGNVLLMIGEGEIVYKSIDDVVNRAKRTLPNLSYESIPKAGHLGAWDNPEFVNEKILAFLKK